MLLKLVTALLSALILSAVLGALPCEATGTKRDETHGAAALGTTTIHAGEARAMFGGGTHPR